MAEEEPKDLRADGTFSYTPSPIAQAPFIEAGRGQKPLHSSSKLFKGTGATKRGQTGSNWGPDPESGSASRKVNLLFEGEVYKDPHKNRAEGNQKARAKFMNERGFVPSNPPKKS
jgi:hypothetical protein